MYPTSPILPVQHVSASIQSPRFLQIASRALNARASAPMLWDTPISTTIRALCVSEGKDRKRCVRTWFWFPVLSSCWLAPLPIAFNWIDSPAHPSAFAARQRASIHHWSAHPDAAQCSEFDTLPPRSTCPVAALHFQASHPPCSLFASPALHCVERLYATEVCLRLFCISELMGVRRSVLCPRAQHGWGKIAHKF
jgi:hypothetical protein